MIETLIETAVETSRQTTVETFETEGNGQTVDALAKQGTLSRKETTTT